MSIDVEKFVSGLHEYLERAFVPLVKRIDEQDARIAKLEAALAALGSELGGE